MKSKGKHAIHTCPFTGKKTHMIITSEANGYAYGYVVGDSTRFRTGFRLATIAYVSETRANY